MILVKENLLVFIKKQMFIKENKSQGKTKQYTKLNLLKSSSWQFAAVMFSLCLEVFSIIITLRCVHILPNTTSWLGGKGSTCQCQRVGLNPWIRKIPWRRKWQLTPVFLPGEFHGQRSPAGYSPWGLKRVRHDLATTQQKSLGRVGRRMWGCLLGYVDPALSTGWIT